MLDTSYYSGTEFQQTLWFLIYIFRREGEPHKQKKWHLLEDQGKRGQNRIHSQNLPFPKIMVTKIWVNFINAYRPYLVNFMPLPILGIVLIALLSSRGSGVFFWYLIFAHFRSPPLEYTSPCEQKKILGYISSILNSFHMWKYYQIPLSPQNNIRLFRQN